MIHDPWTKEFHLNGPAAGVLRRLVEALPAGRHFEITLFGSAPLQLQVDENFLSGDVDLFSNFEELEAIVESAGLSDEQRRPYIQVCSGLNFRTSPH